MLNRHVLEALDRTLRDLKRNSNGIFGGIPVVLAGIIILYHLISDNQSHNQSHYQVFEFHS